jgi:aspartate kinase
VTEPTPVVLKFGGAALEHPERVLARLRRLRDEGRYAVAVISARAGITDRLQRVSGASPTAAQRDALLRRLERAHPGLPRSGREELQRLARRLSVRPTSGAEATQRAHDILASGERLAVRWLARFLTERGVPAEPLDADALGLRAGARPSRGELDVPRSRAEVLRGLRRVRRAGRIPLVTGYIARAARGRVRTLGRGGSDCSAVALAAIVGAREVELVKDQHPVMTADPQVVRGAQPVPELEYADAEALSQTGARVLHPGAVHLARTHRIGIITSALRAPGRTSRVGAGSRGPVRGVALRSGMTRFEVRGVGHARRRRVLVALVADLRRSGLELGPVLQTRSGAALVLPSAEGRRLRQLLRSGDRVPGARLGPPRAVALITLVGVPRAELMPVLRASGWDILGLSVTARTITVAVPARQGTRALRVLHRRVILSAVRRPEPVRGEAIPRATVVPGGPLVGEADAPAA